jgi:hypothetical protein
VAIRGIPAGPLRAAVRAFHHNVVHALNNASARRRVAELNVVLNGTLIELIERIRAIFSK